MQRSVGIDLGNTVFYRKDGIKVVYDDAFRVLCRLTDDEYVDIFIISKVTPEEEKSAIKWFDEVNFFTETGIKPEQVHFCRERKDKAVIAEKVGLSHHIDDRPEVMFHMDVNIVKYLFRPEGADLVKYYNQLRTHDVRVINAWTEFEKHFFIQ